MSTTITITVSATSISFYFPIDPVEKRYISTQLDRYVPEKFIQNHPLFVSFVKYFIEFIEEHKQIKELNIWDSTKLYQIGSIVFWKGKFYSCIGENIAVDPSEDIFYWKSVFYNTLGSYEHITNFSNYTNIDFIVDDFEITDRLDLYDKVINVMVEELVLDRKIYKSTGGIKYQDLVFMIKRFNMEKITSKPFVRAVNYIRNVNPEVNVEFAESRAELIDKLSWSMTRTYSMGEMVIYDLDFCYKSLQNLNVGNQPDVSPSFWQKYPKHMLIDEIFDMPMEYGDRFRYFINTNDFRINNLIGMFHPCGYLLDVVYFPVYIAKVLIPALGNSIQASGVGEISAVFDYML